MKRQELVPLIGGPEDGREVMMRSGDTDLHVPAVNGRHVYKRSGDRMVYHGKETADDNDKRRGRP